MTTFGWIILLGGLILIIPAFIFQILGIVKRKRSLQLISCILNSVALPVLLLSLVQYAIFTSSLFSGSVIKILFMYVLLPLIGMCIIANLVLQWVSFGKQIDKMNKITMILNAVIVGVFIVSNFTVLIFQIFV